MFPRLPRPRLFRIAGIDVYLDLGWFIAIVYLISQRKGEYSSILWSAAECLLLFLIVLLHEFGHSLACRQVGGTANRIVLWPLGGVAYATPPPRPGALLWTIAAGPLVNVVLLPVFFMLVLATRGWEESAPDARHLAVMLFRIDLGLLIFNILPIYPLDGGQILHALLWFWLGFKRGLLAAIRVGVAGGLGLLGLAVWAGDWWLGLIALFILSRCWQSYQQARMISQLENPQRGTPPV